MQDKLLEIRLDGFHFLGELRQEPGVQLIRGLGGIGAVDLLGLVVCANLFALRLESDCLLLHVIVGGLLADDRVDVHR